MVALRKKSTLPISVVEYQHCPAKTFTTPSGEIIPGRSVFNHCQIVGDVAAEILRRMPNDLVQALFPSGSAFTAATHDIGKVSPTFYEKIRRACSSGTGGLKALNSINPSLEQGWGGMLGSAKLLLNI